MHNAWGNMGSYANTQKWPTEDPKMIAQNMTQQRMMPEVRGAPERNVQNWQNPRTQDSALEEQGFTTKLRLNVPNHFEVGIVCMPNIMRDFMLTSLEAIHGDKNGSNNIEKNMERWKATGVGRSKAMENREFRTRPGNVDADCYFMLIEREGENTAMLVPVSQYITLDPVTAPKTGNTLTEKRVDTSGHVVDERLERIVKADGGSDGADRKSTQEGQTGQNKTKTWANNIPWDYEAAPSDDEELYPQVEHEDDDDPLNQPNLTVYGHKMKSLLQQQMEREVDEELKEYSDEEEAAYAAVTGKQIRGREPADPVTRKKTKTETNKATTIDDRVVKYLRQNNGKVPVKGVLTHFNITAKNEEFRLIQNVIQKCCTMSSEDKGGTKIKYIALKPEYQ